MSTHRHRIAIASHRHRNNNHDTDRAYSLCLLLRGRRGVVVELTPRIRGFVPHSHLADVAIRKIGAKFKIDQKVKCRVLRLDVAKRDLILSCKRTLVNSDLPLITSFSGIKAGVITHGVITAIKPFGCLVSFYNGVVGLAPLRHLAAEPVAPADVPKLFQLNQPVKCRVLFVKPKIRSLVVSFITQIADTPNAISIDEQKAAAFVQIAVGSVVENATVTAKTSNGISVVLPDGFQGHVAIEHLSDHQSLTTELHSAIQVGAVYVILSLSLSLCLTHSLILLLPFLVVDCHHCWSSRNPINACA